MAIVKTALTLKDLPTPPEGKTGWPWTEQTEPLPDKMPNGSEWPRISIVTPSYNQGQFIEETIRSVLLQGYSNLEYIIIDGGSTDNSVEILKKYDKYLAYWATERDKGQSHALNKGFSIATGQLIGWQNSDDYYHSGSFAQAAQISLLFKEIDIIYGYTKYVDTNGNFLRDYPVSNFDIHEMIPYLNMCNQSMFFTKKIFEQNNFICENFLHAMDQDLLLRLAIKEYKFHLCSNIIGYYRMHENAKGFKQYRICLHECLLIYGYIQRNKTLSNSIRNKAILCIKGVCLESFRQIDLEVFHESIKELFLISKFKYFDIKLIIKYLLSFLGTHNLKRLMSIKGLWK